jgi:hypothetical protein
LFFNLQPADDKTRVNSTGSVSRQHHSNEESPKYTENGVMDLSMKKPRRSSPPLQPPAPMSKANSSSSGTRSTRDAEAASSSSKSQVNDPSKSSIDMLNALAQSHKAYAEQAAMMQFLTGHPMSGSSSRVPDANADLSLSLAAAAALLPPVYDSLTGLFYSPSALATMAAANSAGVMNTGASTPGVSSESNKLAHGKVGRGRRSGAGSGSCSSNGRVGSGRPASSNFISNLMPKMQEQHGRHGDGSDLKTGQGHTGGVRDDTERGSRHFDNHTTEASCSLFMLLQRWLRDR